MNDNIIDEFILMFGGYRGEPSYDEKHYETGIIKIERGENKFNYYYVKTNKQVSKEDLTRIGKLNIPPSWKNVWISGDKSSAIQAVGIDAKNRKQYRYNPTHIVAAEKNKFLRLYDFIQKLPKLNKNLIKHQKNNVYDKDRVISTMLILVKELHFRVGKEQYARKNKSYGIASLKKSHVKVLGNLVKFNFMGKSKQRHTLSIRDDGISSHINMLLKLEGEKLFQYIDANNVIKHISDLDLNQYIKKYMGDQFVIKDFRTYSANYYFIKALMNETKKDNNNIKKNIMNAIISSAKHLGHTKNISKKAYIMAFCIKLYVEHPEFFVSRKYENPEEVLFEILKLYKQKMK